MTEFFMAMIPPTATAQEHKVAVRNGKPIFYDHPMSRRQKKSSRQTLQGTDRLKNTSVG